MDAMSRLSGSPENANFESACSKRCGMNPKNCRRIECNAKNPSWLRIAAWTGAISAGSKMGSSGAATRRPFDFHTLVCELDFDRVRSRRGDARS
jgi:hypothetical protein